MTYPSKPAAIEAEMKQLQTDFPGLVTVRPTNSASPEGRPISYMSVTARPLIQIPPAVPVLVTGGHHAREFAPPDALLTFVRKLLTAYQANGPIRYNRVTAPNPPNPILVFEKFSISAPTVKKILTELELNILPCVNPDGRQYCMTTDLDWRKTRNPKGASATCANPSPPPAMLAPVGTDPNRNYDIAWDFQQYYSDAFEASGKLSASKDPCDFQAFIGPPSAPHLPEIEVDNVQRLITGLGIRYFIDIHSCGHSINHPWAMEDNQSNDPIKSFQALLFDRVPPIPGGVGGRDGNAPGYKEFFPNGGPLTLLDRHKTVVEATRDQIVANAGADVKAQAQCLYVAGTAPGTLGYYASGTSVDFAFSRQLLPGAPVAPIYGFLIESGSRDIAVDGGFQPTAAQFPKIEREIHAALALMLGQAASWH